MLEQEGIYIRSKALDFSNPEGPVVLYEIDNHTEGAIGFSFYGVSVNGIMIRPHFSPWEELEEENLYSRILPGNSAIVDMIFPKEAWEFARILDNLLRYKIEKELSRCQLKEEDNMMMNSNVEQSA